jgi:hypothetical protein
MFSIRGHVYQTYYYDRKSIQSFLLNRERTLRSSIKRSSIGRGMKRRCRKKTKRFMNQYLF